MKLSVCNLIAKPHTAVFTSFPVSSSSKSLQFVYKLSLYSTTSFILPKIDQCFSFDTEIILFSF